MVGRLVDQPFAPPQPPPTPLGTICFEYCQSLDASKLEVYGENIARSLVVSVFLWPRYRSKDWGELPVTKWKRRRQGKNRNWSQRLVKLVPWRHSEIMRKDRLRWCWKGFILVRHEYSLTALDPFFSIRHLTRFDLSACSCSVNLSSRLLLNIVLSSSAVHMSLSTTQQQRSKSEGDCTCSEENFLPFAEKGKLFMFF